MGSEKIVAGLDIGTTSIRVLVGRQNSQGQLILMGTGCAKSEGVVNGVVTNIDKTVSAIETAVKQAEERSGIDINVVNVGITGRHIKSMSHRGGITREAIDEEITVDDVARLTKDMYRMVTPPGYEIIHATPQHYTVDYEAPIKDPVGMSGVRLEADFHIITAKASAINNVYKSIERAGLEVDHLILEPLASSMALLSHEEKEAGVCLVDLGGGTTNIAIFHESMIRHTSVIPLGGNNISADIKQGCGIMDAQAERIKVRFGDAVASEVPNHIFVTIPGLRSRPPKHVLKRNVAHIIEARVEEIATLIQEEIVLSGLKDKLSAGIVLTGGTAQMPHIAQIFEELTELDTRVGVLMDHVDENLEEEVEGPVYATGLGLVLAGFSALDYREEHYRSARHHKNQLGNRQHKQRSKDKGSEGFLHRLLQRARGLLLDDYDEKGEY